MIFTVPVEPQGKARARTVLRGGKVHSYTPKNTKEYEDTIKFFCNHQMKLQHINKFENAVKVDIEAYFKPKKSATKKELEAIRQGKRPQKKPDVDNIAKSVLDALNGVLYKDDKQVVGLTVSKHYAEEAHIVVSCEEL